MSLDQVILICVALVNAFTAVLTWRAHSLIKQVEVATNSMKDQLVAATGEAAHAAGMEEQRGLSDKKAATLAEGVLQGTKQEK